MSYDNKKKNNEPEAEELADSNLSFVESLSSFNFFIFAFMSLCFLFPSSSSDSNPEILVFNDAICEANDI